MSELPSFAKDYADKFKNKKGIVDFYQFLGVSRSASTDEITHAIMTKAAAVEDSVTDNYLKMTMLSIAQKHLGTQEARAAYDKKLISTWRRLLDRADTRAKRIALLAFPFFAVVALHRFDQETGHDYYGRLDWEPSLSFFLFTMASVLCLLIAFTRMGDWLRSAA